METAIFTKNLIIGLIVSFLPNIYFYIPLHIFSYSISPISSLFLLGARASFNRAAAYIRAHGIGTYARIHITSYSQRLRVCIYMLITFRTPAK